VERYTVNIIKHMMLDNSVAVPCVAYILEGIAARIAADAEKEAA
jgi:hypothetical protein